MIGNTVEETMAVLGDKWIISILHALYGGTLRFGELRDCLIRGNNPGEEISISPKSLSERLKLLKRLGLVTRVSFDEIPPRVEYSLTDDGKYCAEALERAFEIITAKAQGEGESR